MGFVVDGAADQPVAVKPGDGDSVVLEHPLEVGAFTHHETSGAIGTSSPHSWRAGVSVR